MGTAVVLSNTVTLRAANLAALGTNPFTLIPAQGPNTTIVYLGSLSHYQFGTTPYTNPAVSSPTQSALTKVGFPYAIKASSNPAALFQTNIQDPSLLPAANNQLCQFMGTLSYPAADAILNTENQPIQMLMGGAILSSQISTVVQEGKIRTSSITAGGSGYAVGDTGYFTINTGGDNADFYTVNSVDGSGAVLTYTVTNVIAGDPLSTGAEATNYIAGDTSTTTRSGSQPGSGSGFTILISGVYPGGSQYQVNDTFGIGGFTGPTSNAATAVVDSVGVYGQVLTYHLSVAGLTYGFLGLTALQTGQATPSGGYGVLVDITCAGYTGGDGTLTITSFYVVM